MAALFTAFDISGLEASVSAALILGVGITLLFVGYRKIKQIAYSV